MTIIRIKLIIAIIIIIIILLSRTPAFINRVPSEVEAERARRRQILEAVYCYHHNNYCHDHIDNIIIIIIISIIIILLSRTPALFKRLPSEVEAERARRQILEAVYCYHYHDYHDHNDNDVG